jgi:ATP-binding cassette, subfamily G (WHITE), member 2, PDR
MEQEQSKNQSNEHRSLGNSQSEDTCLDKLQVGLSFRNLHCHGFSTSGQYQKTFPDLLLAIPKLFMGYLGPNTEPASHILRGFEGMIQPGEMLLVLGRPGSGCSTFLKTLAGDARGFRIDTESQINYQGEKLQLTLVSQIAEPIQGISYDKFHKSFAGDRVYLAELDAHFAELTLGQTLNFATKTRKEHPDPDAGRKAASDLGLVEAFDTQIGNALIRGVSGGEKRRTSIAEAVIGGAQLQFWDNSTRGLDSSTARRFIELLRQSTYRNRSTVAMSLYQASESMYKVGNAITRVEYTPRSKTKLTLKAL